MPASVTLTRLSPLLLPDRLGLRRTPVIPEAARGKDHDARYDWTTLAHGAVWRPDRRALVLVGPPWRNLAALLPEAVFRSERGPHRLLRRRRYRRHDELWLSAPEPPQALEVELRGSVASLPVTGPLPGFAGTRAVMTISQDNDLRWIADWAGHLVRHQGAETVLFIDNRSTAYPPEGIAATLAAVPGLKAAHVMSVDLPYGPMATRAPRGLALFLQAGLLNLCRHGWLREAAAVLHCDIDELLVSDRGTLFDRALASRLGYATAAASWRFRDPSARGLPRFAEHVWRPDPPRSSKEKWIVCPSGPLGDTVWQTHGVAGYWLNRLAMDRRSRFYHCESIATNWKRPRDQSPGSGLVPDPATAADFLRLGIGEAAPRPSAGVPAGPPP